MNVLRRIHLGAAIVFLLGRYLLGPYFESESIIRLIIGWILTIWGGLIVFIYAVTFDK